MVCQSTGQKKGCEGRYFTRQNLIDGISFIITKCYFTIQNPLFEQEILVLMGIDPAPYSIQLPFLYFAEPKYIQRLTCNGSPRCYKFHGTWRFIDNLYIINDDGELSSPYKYIYPKRLGLKPDHQEEHLKSLDLDITTEDNVFAYKLFDKSGKFPSFVEWVPYTSSNVPSSVFCCSIFL